MSSRRRQSPRGSPAVSVVPPIPPRSLPTPSHRRRSAPVTPLRSPPFVSGSDSGRGALEFDSSSGEEDNTKQRNGRRRADPARRGRPHSRSNARSQAIRPPTSSSSSPSLRNGTRSPASPHPSRSSPSHVASTPTPKTSNSAKSAPLSSNGLRRSQKRRRHSLRTDGKDENEDDDEWMKGASESSDDSDDGGKQSQSQQSWRSRSSTSQPRSIASPRKQQKRDADDDDAPRHNAPITPARGSKRESTRVSTLASLSAQRGQKDRAVAEIILKQHAATSTSHATPSSSSRSSTRATKPNSTLKPKPKPAPSRTSASAAKFEAHRDEADDNDMKDDQEEGDKDDVCRLCLDGGILLVCDLCVHAYHQSCLEDAHQDNYESLKQLGPDDALTCDMVHQNCTQRKQIRKLKMMYDEEDEASRMTTSSSTGRAVPFKWYGKPTHRDGRKYYKAFTRDSIDVYTPGCFVTLSSGCESQPDYVGQIESMWEEVDTGSRMVEVRWFYLPQETRQGRLPSHGAEEVFETTHVDENEVEAIQDLCEVLTYEEYMARKEEEERQGSGGSKSSSSSSAAAQDKRRVYFVRQRYDDDRGEFMPIVKGTGLIGSSLRHGGVNQRDKLLSVARQSLVNLASSPAPSPLKSGGGGTNRLLGSIYTQACAQLQLSAAPPRLPCRDKEHAFIYRFLEAGIRRGQADGGLYIAGVPGTGKTATVVRVISELAQRSDLPNFEYVEINGMKLPEPHQLYTALWKALTGKQASPQKAAMYLDQRFRTKNDRRPICVLLVDELDYIMTRQQNVIYNLFDWPGRRSARLLVVGISNTIDLPDLLMPRVHSRLGLTKLHFEPYNSDQIRRIIHARLEALPAFSSDAVELCARKIASVSGDIRRALQICRRAAEMAEEELTRVEEERKKERRKKARTNDGGSTAAASSLPTSSSTTTPSLPDGMIGETHILRAISDLQNSMFIQYLREGVASASNDLVTILMVGMLASIKFHVTTGPGSGTGGSSGEGRATTGAAAALASLGDHNPAIALPVLVDHTTRIMEARGMRKWISDTCRVAVSLMPNNPTMQEWNEVVQQLAQMQIVHLAYIRGERWPYVQLNMLVEDIEHAFRGDDLWDRLRSS